MISSEQLRHKIAEVVQVFPWYDALIRHRNINNITDLPLMSDTMLEKYYYQQSFDPTYQEYQTSGTSSKKRKKIIYSPDDEQYYIETKKALFSNIIGRNGIKKAVADMGTGHAAHTALLIFKSLHMQCESISFQLPIEKHIELLQSYQPDLLYTMPSILDSLLYAADNPLSFGIKKIILVGEIATKEWIRTIADRLHIQISDIIDTYGSIEIGTLAYFSHELNRYVLLDDLHAEGIPLNELDATLDPLRDNEQILVLTAMKRQLFPALRFVTYDVVRDLQTTIIQGKGRQTFECIVKRVGNERKHGEKISIYDIEEVVYKYIRDATIRVKVERNELEVQIQSKTATNEMLPVIQKELQQQIPEIGEMIKNQMLHAIQVTLLADDALLLKGSVKNKKIYD